MFGKKLRVAAVLCLLAGLAVLLFPAGSQAVYRRQARRVISRFEQSQEEAVVDQPDYYSELYEAMMAYNRQLYLEGQRELADPFAYEQVDFSLLDYGFDEELIGYLDIPKMDLKLPVYLGASEANMRKGAAHLTQTSLPVGGINTNAVICAHRGMGTAAMFRDIEKLEIGDTVSITNFRETLHYRVSEIKIILPGDMEEILIRPGEDMVTLLTCHPYRYNYQRYAVYCTRVE